MAHLLDRHDQRIRLPRDLTAGESARPAIPADVSRLVQGSLKCLAAFERGSSSPDPGGGWGQAHKCRKHTSRPNLLGHPVLFCKRPSSPRKREWVNLPNLHNPSHASLHPVSTEKVVSSLKSQAGEGNANIAMIDLDEAWEKCKIY